MQREFKIGDTVAVLDDVIKKIKSTIAENAIDIKRHLNKQTIYLVFS